jgi:hypothetical protein
VERPVGSLALLSQRAQPAPLGDEERYGLRDVADGLDVNPFVECVDVDRARPVGQSRHPSKVRVDPPIQVARCGEGLQWSAEHFLVGRAEHFFGFAAFFESISCGEETGSFQAWQATVLTAPSDARVPQMLLDLFPCLFRLDPWIDGGTYGELTP